MNLFYHRDEPITVSHEEIHNATEILKVKEAAVNNTFVKYIIYFLGPH